jgi:hypothetical protein
MDFRSIELGRLQFDSPNKKRATWKSQARYGSEKRLVFQTPPFRAIVTQHKFLPDAMTLQKSSTMHDLQPFTDFLDSLTSVFDASIGNESGGASAASGRTPVDYLTVGGETVVYGETDTLQPGDGCRVACLIALTGGWCKPDENGAILSRGLTFEVDEVKVYDLDTRATRVPRVYVDGKAVESLTQQN